MLSKETKFECSFLNPSNRYPILAVQTPSPEYIQTPNRSSGQKIHLHPNTSGNWRLTRTIFSSFWIKCLKWIQCVNNKMKKAQKKWITLKKACLIHGSFFDLRIPRFQSLVFHWVCHCQKRTKVGGSKTIRYRRSLNYKLYQLGIGQRRNPEGLLGTLWEIKAFGFRGEYGRKAET